MANKKLVQVQINSVDVTADLLSYSIDEDWGKPIDEADLKFTQNVTSSVTLATNQTVEIWEGYVTATDLKVFSGELEVYEPDTGTIKVKASNKLNAAVRKQINAKIYDKDAGGNEINPDGKVSDAFEDIVTTYTGLTADGTTIQDTGTAITLTRFICDHTDPKERLDRLAEIMNWIYYYRADTDKVYFEPKGTTVNSTILTVGTNVVNVPKWKYDQTDLINSLRLDGAFQEDQFEQLFTGDAATTTFTLTNTPTGDVALYYGDTVNLASTAPLQNQLQTLGVEDGTAGAFDYSVDRANKEITTSGFTPSANTNNLLARYVGVKAVPVHNQDDISIASYGEHSRTVQLTDMVTVADALSRIQEVLQKFKEPFQSAKLNVLNVSGGNYRVGESIRVVDNTNSPAVDKFFTIFGIERRFPGGFDVLKVGDREFDPPEYFINVNERLHRLERELIDEDTVLTELRQVSYDITFEPHSLTITEEYINDSFIDDHAVNSIIYDAGETSIVDDFEVVGSWSAGSGSLALLLLPDSTAGRYWVGTQGMEVRWSGGGGTAIVENTDAQGDLSSVTGVASGTPTQGTAGVWIYTDTHASEITEVRLRIGSSATDYKEYIGQTYPQKVAGTEVSFTLDDAARKYVLFDLDSPDATAGTADWTAVDFVQFRIAVSSSSGDCVLDYHTVSKNDTIALNGLGLRETNKATTTYNY